MAKHPWLFNREGRYYLRARVPADLIAVMGRREVKKSLKTSDFREARRRINVEAAELEAQFAEARREGRRRPATHLTEAEVRQLVIGWFYELERDGAQARWAETDESPSDLADIDQAYGYDETVLTDPADPNRLAAVQGLADSLLRERRIQLDQTEPMYRLLCELLNRGLVEQVRRGRARAMGDLAHQSFDALFDAVSADRAPQTQPATPGQTLEELIEQFRRHRGAQGTEQNTLAGYALLFDALAELFGHDKPVSEIDRADCRRIKDLFEKLPANARKRFPAKTLVEAAEYAHRRGLAPLSPVTANSHLSKLSAFLRWAEREEYIDRNPAVGLRVAAPEQSKRDARRPFSTDQLVQIFNAPLYIGCEDDEAGYARPGPNRPRRARFWVPLLGLFHGLRMNEACQLHTTDVVTMNGVTVIHVRPEGDGKKLKSDAARRYVPLHPEVDRIGFADYVEAMRDRGEARLFPELRQDARGYYSDAFQKWFSRFLDRCGAKAPRTSFHSFRHCWADAMREAGVPQERMRLLGGWAGSGVDANYGSGLRPSTLSREIAKVRYPGLDLSYLYD